MSEITLLPEVRAFLSRDHGHFIGGKPYAGRSEKKIEVVNPANGQIIASVREADNDDIQAALSSARDAFENAWANTPPLQRGYVLNRLADLLIEHREELAQLETLSSGKMIQLSRGFEVEMASAFLRFYAGWAGKINGETITPSLPSFQGECYTAYTVREPLGVVVGIVPWNFSIMIAVWKLASALICGCSVVIKPSEYTPLTMLRLAELACDAGIPAGALNVINGRGSIGQQLIEHPLTAKVSFTGSVPTGLAVGKTAMGANLTRVTLELGGKNGAAFLPDMEIGKIVDGILEAGYLHQGQICAAAERFYIHRSQIDAVLDELKVRLSNMTIGSPLDENTQFGPLANKTHFDKVMAFFAKARAENCQIIFGGEAVNREGYYVQPTAIRVNSPQDTLMVEETFGPVGSFLAYDNEDELVSLMNATPFGLSASVWTNNLSKALRLVPQIEAGTVWVNMHTLLDPALPFGGAKASGLGREFGSAFIDDYTELKSVMIRY